MSEDDGHLDPEFIEAQRERLEAMREEIFDVMDDTSEDSHHLQEDDSGIVTDDADEASNLAQQEIDETLRGREDLRLEEVERALEKIAEGTYGLSDESGEPIPRERLEAKPEALFTVEEETVHERLANRPTAAE